MYVLTFQKSRGARAYLGGPNALPALNEMLQFKKIVAHENFF